MPTKNAANWNSQYSTVSPMSGTLALTDNTEYKIDKNVTGCTLTYTRNVTTDNWMGVYLPFDIDVTKVGGTYATLTGANNGILDWTTQETGTIKACTPFIFKPTDFGANEKTRTITFKSSDGKLHSCNENHAATISGYTLAGTFTTKTDMAKIHAYALSAGNFYCTTDPTKTLKPYRIFLTVPASRQGAPVRSRVNGEDTTAINGIELDGDPLDNSGCYNLSGQKVAPAYKGIVIINGKKHLRK